MTLKLFLSCYCCLFCYWKYGKAIVQLSPIWHSNCACLVILLFRYWKYDKATVQLSPIWHSNWFFLVIVVCFAIKNTIKQPFTCLQYDTQIVLVLLLFCFAIENTIKQRSVVSNMTLKLFLSCHCCLFCYWKYGKATVQLSSIWHSNCSCLVIVVCFAIEDTVNQPFTCLQYDTQIVLVLLFFCFAIENTIKQPFSCLQYDTQTVLFLLLLFVLLLKIR